MPTTLKDKPAKRRKPKFSRRVRFIEVTGHLATFRCYSRRTDSKTVEYKPVVDLDNGEAQCTCPNETYRRDGMCWHCRHARATAVRRQLLSPLLLRHQPHLCAFCDEATEVEMADEVTGEANGLNICLGCVYERRAMRERRP